jgi:hypothetical protein
MSAKGGKTRQEERNPRKKQEPKRPISKELAQNRSRDMIQFLRLYLFDQSM